MYFDTMDNDTSSTMIISTVKSVCVGGGCVVIFKAELVLVLLPD